jgi:hypothetical protein
MRIAVILLIAITASAATAVATGLTDSKGGSRGETPCREQNELFCFYFDEPEKTNPALYWIPSRMLTLLDNPCNQAPELMNTVVVIH